VEFFLFIAAVDHLNIDLESVAMKQEGYIATIATTNLPRRLVLTANCYCCDPKFIVCKFAFIIDVLLVPLAFDVRKCFDLYLEPFNPGSQSWYMGLRRLRDNVILLRRFTFRGEDLMCETEQCNISDDIRNRLDYRLVVTSPVFRFHYQGDVINTVRGLYVQLEMEF